jgi:hypothetical protein
MGVVLKYKLEFPEDGLKLSNDAFAGDFIIDADIKAQMARAESGATFEIKLYDLPTKKRELLSKRVKDNKRGKVLITLGYMDGFGATKQVMEGLYTKCETEVADDRQVTTLKGSESGTHALLRSKVNKCFVPADVVQLVTNVLNAATVTEGEVSREVQWNVRPTPLPRFDHGYESERNLLAALTEIAEQANVELAVFDKKIYMGRPVNSSTTPVTFDSVRNLARFRPFDEEIPGDDDAKLPQPLAPTAALGFKFVVTGDPSLRPGQKVIVVADKFEDPTVDFRIHTVVHSYTLSGGYVCEGIAMKAATTEATVQQERKLGTPTASTAVGAVQRRIKEEAGKNPVVELAEVKTYSAGESGQNKHRATLYYNQKFDPPETMPSVHVAVEHNEDKVFPDKPFFSPFAWHKCGLVVPVYVGMKAVLAHNLGLRNDPLVAGFMWSETPAIEPPPSKRGDWWLSLPVDESGKPTDSTKAANDLTAGNGHRTIEAKGLRIAVGASKLVTVGTRPTEAEDDVLLIEHASAKIKVGSDGTIEMTASASGGVTLKITSSGVEVA